MSFEGVSPVCLFFFHSSAWSSGSFLVPRSPFLRGLSKDLKDLNFLLSLSIALPPLGLSLALGLAKALFSLEREALSSLKNSLEDDFLAKGKYGSGFLFLGLCGTLSVPFFVLALFDEETRSKSSSSEFLGQFSEEWIFELFCVAHTRLDSAIMRERIPEEALRRSSRHIALMRPSASLALTRAASRS